MKTVTVDMQHRIHIGGEAPETRFWLLPHPKGCLLQRIPLPDFKTKPTAEKIKALLSKQRVKMGASWQETEPTLPCRSEALPR